MLWGAREKYMRGCVLFADGRGGGGGGAELREIAAACAFMHAMGLSMPVATHAFRPRRWKTCLREVRPRQTLAVWSKDARETVGGEEDRGGGQHRDSQVFRDLGCGRDCGVFFFRVCGGHGVIARGSEACGPGWRPSVSCWSSHHCGPRPPAPLVLLQWRASFLRAFMSKSRFCCVWFSPACFFPQTFFDGFRSIYPGNRWRVSITRGVHHVAVVCFSRRCVRFVRAPLGYVSIYRLVCNGRANQQARKYIYMF